MRRVVTIQLLLAAGFLSSCLPRSTTWNEDVLDRVNTQLAAGDSAAALTTLEKTDLEASARPEFFMMLGALQRSHGTIRGRLESQLTLERGLQLFPNDTGLLMALGRTYYEQTFYPDAKRCFSAALRNDSTLCEARYLLATYHYDNWLRVNEYIDNLKEASDLFATVIDCDSTNVDASMRYLYSLYPLERLTEALACCETFIDRFPERGEFQIFRGVLAYENGDYQSADEDFRRGLPLLDERSRVGYEELTLALGLSDRDQYYATPRFRREAVERSFWLDIDPDPTTTINERFLEHVYRVFLADLFFTVAHSHDHGWATERGETLVKFGRPLAITPSMGDSWMSGHEEVWEYNIDGVYHAFEFVDERLNGNLRIPYNSDYKLAFIRHESLKTSHEQDFVDIPGVLDVITFKDDEFSSSVYLAMTISADSIESATDLATYDRFHIRTTFFDGGWKPELTTADTLWTSEVPRISVRRKSAYTLSSRHAVPFGSYHLACAFADQNGRATFLAKRDCSTERYIAGKLSISDILLHLTGSPRPDGIARNGHTYFPNPGRIYGIDDPVNLYFEVYGLATNHSQSRFTMTIGIFAMTDDGEAAWKRWGRKVAAFAGLLEREAAMLQTFNAAGTTHNDSRDLTINIETLEPGSYEMVVSITDELAGTTAVARTTFEKLGSAGSTTARN